MGSIYNKPEPEEIRLAKLADNLRWQLESAKAELVGFKSGTKEGADILKSELKRVEVERDASKQSWMWRWR